MERLRSIVVAGMIALTFPATARAWDAEGHKLVAVMANQQLNPKAKQAVAELAREMDSPGHAYDAVTVSNWMDDLKRNPSMPYHGVFLSWHYIDLGIAPGDPQPSLEPGNDNEIHGNVVQALKRAVVVLQGGADPYIKTKAMACAMVLHLVADIHQPLHCATKYFFLQGRLVNDKGGNDERVVNAPNTAPGAPPFSLHFFWDQAYRAGFDSATGNVVIAGYLDLRLPPQAPTGKSLEPDFDGWAKESNAIARDFVYHDLTATNDKKSCRLSSVYVDKARMIARAQLILAGQRLAVLLNETLGADQPIHPPPSYPAGPPGEAPF